MQDITISMQKVHRIINRKYKQVKMYLAGEESTLTDFERIYLQSLILKNDDCILQAVSMLVLFELIPHDEA